MEMIPYIVTPSHTVLPVGAQLNGQAQGPAPTAGG